VAVELAKEYRSLPREQLLEKVYDLGFNYPRCSHSCSQCVVAAYHDILGIDEVVVKAATSSCGGQAITILGTCGALIGGTMVLDCFFGRDLGQMSSVRVVDPTPMFDAVKVAGLLHSKFIEEFGDIHCAQIQQKLYGRFFYVLDPDEGEKLEEAKDRFFPKNCWHVIGSSARWVMEILIDKGVVVLD